MAITKNEKKDDGIGKKIYSRVFAVADDESVIRFS